ncbi:MAG: hypothetical protein Q4E57_03065 [Eubacteriales bacterium]|nr:hypothetical protein [Eubacteriales bacterium]
MLELKFKPGQSSYEEMVNDLLGGDYPAFEELERFDCNADQPEEEEHASSLKDVVAALDHAEVAHTETGYSITVYCDQPEQPAEIVPLFITDAKNQKGMKALENGVTFTGITLKELSEFYAIRRGDKSCIVKLRTDNIPEEDRDNAIYNAVIGNRSGFLAYILFMLSENYAEGILGMEEFRKILEYSEKKGERVISPAIYEKLLRAAAYTPDKLDSVEEMMERLNPEVVDDEFRSLIKTFKKAADTGKKKRRGRR